MTVGDIVSGRVTSIESTHFIVELPNDWKGLVHISKISDYYVSKINHFFTLGKVYDFVIQDIDEEKRYMKLSWKKLMPRFLKDPFEFNLHKTENGFKNLKEYTQKEVENNA